MKNWWIVALGVVLGLLGAGIIWLASQPPRGNPIILLPPPTPIPIQVHISGEVKKPGVYALPLDSRVQAAIEAAGGFTDDANKTVLNLAALLEDGARVHVPIHIQAETPIPTTANKSKDEGTTSKSTSLPPDSPSQLVNINYADQAALETLSGIGPVTAQNIILFREENGLFTSIEEIQKVFGIGPVKFEKIKDFITVDQQP